MTYYEIKNLADYPQKKSKIIKLIENSFSYQSYNDYSIDFCLQFQKSNLKNCLFIENSQEILAHIGFIPVIFKLKQLSFTVNFIGSIAVNEKFRNNGIFNYLFKYTLKLLKDTSCLNILWSDKAKLFSKYHFYECGEVYQTGNKDIDFSSRTLDQLSPLEIKTITSLYQNFTLNTFSPARDINFFKVFNKKSSCNVKIFQEEKRIIGYMLFNKGEDLQNIIHEFIIDPLFFQKYLNKYQQYKIWLPTYQAEQQVQKSKEKLFYSAIININNNKEFTKLSQNLTGNLLNQKHYLEKRENQQLALLDLFGPNQNIKTSFPLWIPGINSI